MYVHYVVSDAVIIFSDNMDIAMKRYAFCIDNAAADWWQYHFDDALLRNDVSWRSWRIALQKQLSQDQLNGVACGICGIFVKSDCNRVLLGGYSIAYCLRPCESPLQQEMKQTLSALEASNCP